MERAADAVYRELLFALEDGDELPTRETAQAWSEYLSLIPTDVVQDYIRKNES